MLLLFTRPLEKPGNDENDKKHGENRDAKPVSVKGDGAEHPAERNHENQNQSQDGEARYVEPHAKYRHADGENHDRNGEDRLPGTEAFAGFLGFGRVRGPGYFCRQNNGINRDSAYQFKRQGPSRGDNRWNGRGKRPQEPIESKKTNGRQD